METHISSAHTPSVSGDVLGCDGFNESAAIFCLAVNGDNNFLNYGIIENTMLFVDKSKVFMDNKLNVFEQTNGIFQLSRSSLPGNNYVGRIVAAMNIYE